MSCPRAELKNSRPKMGNLGSLSFGRESHGVDDRVDAATNAQAATATLATAPVGTDAIVFRICEAIW